jgi:hypothetical protein
MRALTAAVTTVFVTLALVAHSDAQQAGRTLVAVLAHADDEGPAGPVGTPLLVTTCTLVEQWDTLSVAVD